MVSEHDKRDTPLSTSDTRSRGAPRCHGSLLPSTALPLICLVFIAGFPSPLSPATAPISIKSSFPVPWPPEWIEWGSPLLRLDSQWPPTSIKLLAWLQRTELPSLIAWKLIWGKKAAFQIMPERTDLSLDAARARDHCESKIQDLDLCFCIVLK